jgi:hypothetical protein
MPTLRRSGGEPAANLQPIDPPTPTVIKSLSTGAQLDHRLQMIAPEGLPQQPAAMNRSQRRSTGAGASSNQRLYSGFALRPCAMMVAETSNSSNAKQAMNIKLRRNGTTHFAKYLCGLPKGKTTVSANAPTVADPEDAFLLRAIESFSAGVFTVPIGRSVALNGIEKVSNLNSRLFYRWEWRKSGSRHSSRRGENVRRGIRRRPISGARKVGFRK